MLPTDSGPRAASSDAERRLAELSPRDRLHARRAMADGYFDIGDEPDDKEALNDYWCTWCEAEQIPTAHLAPIDDDRVVLNLAFPASLGRELSTSGLRAMRRLFRLVSSPISASDHEDVETYVDGREARVVLHRDDVGNVLERVQAVLNNGANSIPDPRAQRPKAEPAAAMTKAICDRCDGPLGIFRSPVTLGISPGLPNLIDEVLCLRCSVVVQDALRGHPEVPRSDRRRAAEEEQREAS